MKAGALAGNRAETVSEVITVAFMAAIVGLAGLAHVPYILFPELAALTGDVLLRPTGKWASEPWKLVATPTISAVIGAYLSIHLPYGVLTILLSMFLSLGVIRLLRSAVSPAISAGTLPIVLGIKSWLYPACILGTLTALAIILLLWRQSDLAKQLPAAATPDNRAVERLESSPQGSWWLPSLTLFVLLIGGTAQITGWHYILFPPLIVMSYEMLGHTDTCPWAKRPYTFPLICASAGLAGVAAARWVGVNPISAILVLTLAFLMLRIGRLRMPPALAIGLIPFILPTPTFRYPLSVAIGSGALTLWFFANTHLKAKWRTPKVAR